MWRGYQINELILGGGGCTVQLLLVSKELGLCLIRRHLQDFDLQGILGESQIIFV